jgi:hypothetical protein
MNPGYLWELSTELLKAALWAVDPSRTGRDLPGRQFIHHGQPVIDFCDTGTLALWHTPIETRQVGRRDAPQVQIVTTFNIELWRCWPVGNNMAPSLSALEDATKMLQTDVWCLITGLQHRLATIASCELLQYQEVRALGPLGGMAGWRVPITLGLSGNTPSL